MMIIGTPEINVPKTGINQNIRTIIERVNIYGKTPQPWTILIIRSQIEVRTEFTIAMSD